ncbi:MAG: hypothetical protein ACTSYM_11990 [Candidatus Baldrarchaeia archaeon]
MEEKSTKNCLEKRKLKPIPKISRTLCGTTKYPSPSAKVTTYIYCKPR